MSPVASLLALLCAATLDHVRSCAFLMVMPERVRKKRLLQGIMAMVSLGTTRIGYARLDGAIDYYDIRVQTFKLHINNHLLSAWGLRYNHPEFESFFSTENLWMRKITYSL